MLGLELVVVLGVCILASSVVSGRLRLAAPVLLVLCGAVLGFVPALESVSLPPEAMLLIFLPALLYWESLNTSLREIRSNLRPIVLLSTLLVLATAAAVAAVAHALGLDWGPAWVLGAALAPTDATAVSAIARGMPRRTTTILRAESLINDGTALVIYAIAIAITTGEQQFSTGRVGLQLLLSYAGGAVAGLAIAWLAVQVRKRLDNPIHETVVSILTPFAAFLLAETVHGSGVIAVVTCGLALARVGPRIVPADTRQVSSAFWGIATFVLNGALFVLIGLQANSAIRSLDGSEILAAFGGIGLVALTVAGTRLLWGYTTPYIIRAIDRRPQQRLRRMGARQRLVSSAAGFRGAVSLAAALAVPETVVGGGPFPFREEIILITSGVVVLTLVVQSLMLPSIIRFSRLPEDTALDEELRLAQATASEEAYEALPGLADKVGVSDVVYKRVLAEYEHHLEVRRAKEAGDEEVAQSEVEYTALRLELIGHKRATVVRLRDEAAIDDIVLRTIQRRLDLEEVRLARREIEED
ncbi:Na+/H+ antiporter [Lentzea kentuckyensis]|uniref:Na+/H+ antiporter n=1 Tax=Lentzea kentuckyensis TaxID=360086 RepID=UPI000A39E0DB|nr:Na+/H+ antiporter [Lentzea kentuckyensis]